MAHELGHVFDGSVYIYSESRSWETAWGEEIDVEGSPLSGYAQTDPQEGFAEFARLLLLQDRGVARQKFPKCYAYWEKEGLV